MMRRLKSIASGRSSVSDPVSEASERAGSISGRRHSVSRSRICVEGNRIVDSLRWFLVWCCCCYWVFAFGGGGGGKWALHWVKGVALPGGMAKRFSFFFLFFFSIIAL